MLRGRFLLRRGQGGLGGGEVLRQLLALQLAHGECGVLQERKARRVIADREDEMLPRGAEVFIHDGLRPHQGIGRPGAGQRERHLHSAADSRLIGRGGGDRNVGRGGGNRFGVRDRRGPRFGIRVRLVGGGGVIVGVIVGAIVGVIVRAIVGAIVGAIVRVIVGVSQFAVVRLFAVGAAAHGGPCSFIGVRVWFGIGIRRAAGFRGRGKPLPYGGVCIVRGCVRVFGGGRVLGCIRVLGGGRVLHAPDLRVLHAHERHALRGPPAALRRAAGAQLDQVHPLRVRGGLGAQKDPDGEQRLDLRAVRVGKPDRQRLDQADPALLHLIFRRQRVQRFLVRLRRDAHRRPGREAAKARFRRHMKVVRAPRTGVSHKAQQLARLLRPARRGGRRPLRLRLLRRSGLRRGELRGVRLGQALRRGRGSLQAVLLRGIGVRGRERPYGFQQQQRQHQAQQPPPE